MLIRTCRLVSLGDLNLASIGPYDALLLWLIFAFFGCLFNTVKRVSIREAAIAMWIRLHLPSCGPEFESQAHHFCFLLLHSSLY